MIGSALAHIAEGVLRPRASVERLLARNPSIADAALMVVLAYCVQGILMLLVPGLREGLLAMGLVEHLFWVLLAVAGTFLLGFLIHIVGRAFGGVASRQQSLVVAAWHSLVMSLLLPVFLAGAMQIEGEEAPPGALLLILLYGAALLWLLASYIAAAHQFRSAWSVASVLIGALILFSAFLSVLRGG